MRIRVVVIFCAFCFLGCATTSSQKGVKEIFQTSEDEQLIDAATALESVSEAIAGKAMTEEELKNLAHDLRYDEDTQTAIKKIADSFEKKSVQVKYSPSTGKRYSAEMEFCPETGVKLLTVE